MDRWPVFLDTFSFEFVKAECSTTVEEEDENKDNDDNKQNDTDYDYSGTKVTRARSSMRNSSTFCTSKIKYSAKCIKTSEATPWISRRRTEITIV